MKLWKKVLLGVLAGPALVAIGFLGGAAGWTTFVNVLEGVFPSASGLNSFGFVTGLVGAVALPYKVFSDDSDD